MPNSLAEMTEWYVATVHDFIADSILVCKTLMEISYTPLTAEELDIQCTEVQSCMARLYIYILPIMVGTETFGTETTQPMSES